MKIGLLKALYDKPINYVKLYIDKTEQLNTLSKYINEHGNTEIIIKFKNKDRYMVFNLDKRNLRNVKKPRYIVRNKLKKDLF